MYWRAALLAAVLALLAALLAAAVLCCCTCCFTYFTCCFTLLAALLAALLATSVLCSPALLTAWCCITARCCTCCFTACCFTCCVTHFTCCFIPLAALLRAALRAAAPLCSPALLYERPALLTVSLFTGNKAVSIAASLRARKYFLPAWQVPAKAFFFWRAFAKAPAHPPAFIAPQ